MQFDPQSRVKEVAAVLAGQVGSVVTVAIDGQTTPITGTLGTATVTTDTANHLSSVLYTVAVSGGVTWRIAPQNIVAVGF